MTKLGERRLPRAIAGELETSRLANGLELCLLRNAQAPIAGVIVGRALYDGRLDLGEALSVLEGAPC